MELPVSPADLQQAVEWLNKGVAMSESPKKKYTAKDMIEFGLTCSLALKKEDVKELQSTAITMALIAYDEAKGQLNGHS